MLKNQILTGTVVAISSGGEGIIKDKGTTIFVPFCLVGEVVEYKILKLKGEIGYGKVEKILTPSAERVAAKCPVFTKCGGCYLQHMSYASELEYKKSAVQNNLKKIGGLSVEIQKVHSGSEYRYRNKLALPVGVVGGKTVCGFYRTHSHDIVPIKDCPIQQAWIGDIIGAMELFCEKSGYVGYDEKTLSGDIRHVVVRELKGEYIVAIVATRQISLKEFEGILLEKLGEKFTLLLNINGQPTNAIFGKEWHICRGEGFLTAEEDGILYKAGANTFVQVNDGVRDKLYKRVREYAEGFNIALDLYSGGGLLTAMLAKTCGKAYGVEIVEEATACANELRDMNGLGERMENICGKVEDKVDELIKRTEGNRVIVCDPPRKGMERSVVRAVERANADRVILVSCNSATLARDAGILCGTLIEVDGQLIKAGDSQEVAGAYEVEACELFDMFPQTPNTETLLILKRK